MSQSTGHRELGRKEQEVVAAVAEQQQQPPVVAQLTALGVAGDVAADLAASHPADAIDRVVAAAGRRSLRSPAGWVVRALREGWDITGSAPPAASAPPPPAVGDGADRLVAAVERVTTVLPGIGRRSVPSVRAQLIGWAVTVAGRSNAPLDDALTADLAARASSPAAAPVAAPDGPLPAPPQCPTAPADLCQRLRLSVPPVRAAGGPTMTANRDRTLTRLHQAAATPGMTLDEIDRRVAAELGVDLGQYFAYLAVAEALDHHPDTTSRPGRSRRSAGPAGASTPLGRAQDSVAAIGWRAATIYQATATGRSTEDVSGLAAGILGSLLQLRQDLRDLDTLERLRVTDGEAASDGSSRGLSRDA